MKALLRLLSLFMVTATASYAADITKISPTEAAELVSAGKAVLVDVREPSEWAESGVAAPAELLPMSDFNGEQKLWRPFLAKNSGKQIILYCRSGNRSGKVAAKLAEQGATVANSGAFKDWAAAGLPVRQVTDKK
ncbi:MAG: rhodanese-like domain-containing protein [Opitutus sp.]